MTTTNRPWAWTITSSISRCMPREIAQPGFWAKLFGKKAERPPVADLSAHLDQVHKLARNYIASLDLGCVNMRLVPIVDNNCSTEGLDGRERYLLWVKNWKLFYKELSVLIRYYKHDRAGNAGHIDRLKETAQVMLNARYNAKLASWAVKQHMKLLNTK